MKLRVKGKGEVTLSRTDFLAQGGEGAVYARGSTAYKVYTDPKHMIPLAKIDELSTITLPNVIRPQDVLMDGSKPVGYTMRYVTDTHALCQLFTKAFKQREGVTDEQVFKLVRALRDGVQHIHDKGILIVDLNEMNFLVDQGFGEVYFIDVDSYQTRSFPATALMDSVKDWHAKRFSAGSDWFSWGVVTFQMFMGVHPYKGKHPRVKGLEERMQQNISVFNVDVSIPQMCPPLDSIPEAYRRWYRAVFETGLREPPPVDAWIVATISPVVTRLASTDKVDVVLTDQFDSVVLRFFASGRHVAVRTKRGLMADRRPSAITADAWFGIVPTNDHVFAAWCEGGRLRLEDLTAGTTIPTTYNAQAVMGYDGRVYAKNGESIFEVQFTQAGDQALLALRPVANAMPQATRLFEGVAIQDMLGAWYASVFPASGQSYQIHLKELRGYKIVDAKYDGRVLVVIGVKAGTYDKFVFVLQPDFQGYVLRTIQDVVYSGVSFVTLENGICAHLVEDGKLELFSVANPAVVKVVEDPVLDSSMMLYKRGTQVLAAQGNQLFRISTRK